MEKKKKEIVKMLLDQDLGEKDEEEILDLLVNKPITVDVDKESDKNMTFGDKAADKISALIKCIEELNMGNREFETAEKSTREKLKELKAPEVDVFLDEFMGSFNLTLDELRY